MKYLFVFVLVFTLGVVNVYSDCTYCNVPDNWNCINDGGQELFGPQGECYRGFITVDVDPDTKTVDCSGDGFNKCSVPNQYWGASLHSALIELANKKIHQDNILTGSDNINMFINGFPRYGSVTWNTNSSTGLYYINTLIN